VATELYNESRVAFAKALLDWEVNDFSMYLVGGAYVFHPGHNLASIPPAERMAGPVPITTRSVDIEGWCVGDDVIFEGVPDTSVPITGVVIYSPTNPYLAWYSDILTGLPFTSIGGTYVVRLTNAEQAYFRL